MARVLGSLDGSFAGNWKADAGRFPRRRRRSTATTRTGRRCPSTCFTELLLGFLVKEEGQQTTTTTTKKHPPSCGNQVPKLIGPWRVPFFLPGFYRVSLLFPFPKKMKQEFPEAGSGFRRIRSGRKGFSGDESIWSGSSTGFFMGLSHWVDQFSWISWLDLVFFDSM